ncbi:hypothetical protein MRV_0132 [Murine roseolovirus]|uniref:Uncharacterized protein n=1 Tax=Murid betaherpesvirus 3 TaxID=2560603 RepID=A0A1P8VIQ2_9BETA|nr:hypothetical protein MRV_0004 [Murine roseolovirus]YP_009344959.1 hypothetical protein MRV_0132 [Murine roseolovirus]APZ76215.1 hypothetical protein MRV_0004 [Murid betaherpesvirus 3]APZ76343.1 hypothetical protein MRV_0132 [Murid betaherpesvirus 3]
MELAEGVGAGGVGQVIEVFGGLEGPLEQELPHPHIYQVSHAGGHRGHRPAQLPGADDGADLRHDQPGHYSISPGGGSESQGDDAPGHRHPLPKSWVGVGQVGLDLGEGVRAVFDQPLGVLEGEPHLPMFDCGQDEGHALVLSSEGLHDHAPIFPRRHIPHLLQELHHPWCHVTCDLPLTGRSKEPLVRASESGWDIFDPAVSLAPYGSHHLPPGCFWQSLEVEHGPQGRLLTGSGRLIGTLVLEGGGGGEEQLGGGSISDVAHD